MKNADIVQKIFHRNEWKNSWRNGIYNFHHYHSTTHECLACCSGKVIIILDGPNGKTMEMEKGDIIILPAGTGHKCNWSSDDFLCVGAYSQGKDFDMNYGKASEYKAAVSRISKLFTLGYDPVFGKKVFPEVNMEMIVIYKFNSCKNYK